MESLSRNQFWKILYELLDTQASQVYEERVSFIKSKKIAVWDVIGNCYREGSLDSNIREEKVNNFSALFMSYPDIIARTKYYVEQMILQYVN